MLNLFFILFFYIKMGTNLCYNKKNEKEKIIEEYFDNKSSLNLTTENENSIISFSNVEFQTISNLKKNKILKDYKIIKKIGVGSFGVVYLSINLFTSQYFAIKCVNKQKVLKGGKNSLEHLKSEIEIMEKLNSKHIIKLHKIFQDQTNYYLILDYCDKGDFKNYLKNRNKKFLKEKEAVFFFKQIKEAFIILRKNNILHRDIKLENLFINGSTLKIGDFGFSKITEDFTNSKLGSKFTMAPEIIFNIDNSRQYNYKCDLWSLGCVFYEMLFGERFLFENLRTEKNNIIKAICETLRDYKEGEIFFPRYISKNMEDLLRKMLVKDERKRISFLGFISHPVFFEDNQNFNFQRKQFSLRNIQPITPRNKQFISFRKFNFNNY